MQKKLIALAVAGLVSAPAFAADNVTIYGVMGAYYQNQKLNVGGVGSTINSLNTDGQSGSRLGFRGTEDLGNGLKAVFLMESGLNVDTAGATVNSGQIGIGNRQVYVGLQGGFGGLTAGRQYSPMFDLQAATFDTWGYADWSPVILAGMANNVRINNSVTYASPNMSGFSAKVQYAFGEVPSNNVGNGAGNQWGMNLMYANGPIKAGLAHHQVKNGNGTITPAAACAAVVGAAACGGIAPVAAVASTGSNKWTDLGGTYNFGMATASFAYQWEKTAAGVKGKAWQLGVDAKVGAAGTALASYVKRDPNTSVGNNDVSSYALGYSHALSKRTNLVGTYSKTKMEVVGGTNTDKRIIGGVRHTF